MSTTEFKRWEDLSELEQLESTYCEMHKDVYGIKARWYRAESVEQAKADLERLSAALNVQIEAEERAQQEAVAAFQMLEASYGYEQAKRWQHDACGTGGDDERLEWELGLPFHYFKKREQNAA